MSSTSCCGGSCGCGSGCKCQSGGGGCKTNPDTTTTTVSAVAPNKSCCEGSEKGGPKSAEHDGCKCGGKCTCNPCACK